MRRSTPGSLTAAELKTIDKAERHAPERVIAALEPFVTDARKARIRAVVDQRLEGVTVLFDAPHDPHNGAAVLRSCEAFGVHYLHVVERWERFLSAASVARSAERWVDLVPHPSANDALAMLAPRGFEFIGAKPDGELLPNDLRAIPKLCLVLGNERDGIAKDLESACTRFVRVPMRGMVESLNVSVTAAILLASATEGREGDLDAADRKRLYARGLYFSLRDAERIIESTAPAREADVRTT